MDSVILEFIKNHYVDITIILCTVVAVYFFLRWIVNTKNAKVKKLVYSLVIESEKFLGTKTGQLKKKQVVSWFYSRYPVLSVFVKQTTLEKIIDESVKFVGDFIEENDANLYTLEDELKHKR